MKKTSFVRKQNFFRLAVIIAIIVFINILTSSFFRRIDLTDDHRFTLSDSTIQMLKHLNGSVFIHVYLKSDEMPPNYQRLAGATRELLDEFRNYCGAKLQYQFEDPLAGKNEEDKMKILGDFHKKGMEPVLAKAENTSADYKSLWVIPCATVNVNNEEEMPVRLTMNTGAITEESLNESVAQLENQFASVIRALSHPARPAIAYVSGHDELQPVSTFDIDTTLKLSYDISYVDLPHSYVIDPKFKCLIVAKPQERISPQEEFLLDQYVMHGGRILWLVETMKAEYDSIFFNKKNAFMALPYNFDLTQDLFFKWGFRLNIDIIADKNCEGVQLKNQAAKIFYFPVLQVNHDAGNPIVKNMDDVLGIFCSTIDTVEKVSGVRKTVLLHTSNASGVIGGGPTMIDRKEFTQPVLTAFNRKNLIAGLLLEGSFKSNFTNRVPQSFLDIWKDSLKQTFVEKSPDTKMIVISDGDFIRNSYDRNSGTLILGYYPPRQTFYANKNFLLNCIDYLTGNTGNIEPRNKVVKLRLLDNEKVKAEKTKWQLLNMLVPLAFVILFAFIFMLVRQVRFAKK